MAGNNAGRNEKCPQENTKGGQQNLLHLWPEITRDGIRPLHDIATTNIVWCMAYARGEGKGGRACAIVVQLYCNSVGDAGRERNIRMINSCTEALR